MSVTASCGPVTLSVSLAQEERVTSRDLLADRCSFEEYDRLLRTAVDRVDELQSPDAVVVRRLDFSEDLLDVRHAEVTSRIGNGDRGCLVGQDIDDVVG